MAYAKKIVLHCRKGDMPELDGLIETFIRDGVRFVGVAGKDCARIEDIIDELVVGDGSRDYDLLTASHPGETIQEAIEFAESLTGDFEGPAQLVEL